MLTIAEYMSIPDAYNYFLSYKFLYFIASNEYFWKCVCYRYTPKKLYVNPNMKCKKKSTGHNSGHLKENFILEIYKKQGLWKKTVKEINIKYTSIYKHPYREYILFEREIFKIIKKGKEFRKDNGKMDTAKIKKYVSELYHKNNIKDKTRKYVKELKMELDDIRINKILYRGFRTVLHFERSVTHEKYLLESKM